MSSDGDRGAIRHLEKNKQPRRTVMVIVLLRMLQMMRMMRCGRRSEIKVRRSDRGSSRSIMMMRSSDANAEDHSDGDAGEEAHPIRTAAVI